MTQTDLPPLVPLKAFADAARWSRKRAKTTLAALGLLQRQGRWYYVPRGELRRAFPDVYVDLEARLLGALEVDGDAPAGSGREYPRVAGSGRE